MTLLTPTTMTYGGAALARHEGQVVFVPYALPNETVEAALPESRKKWVEATLDAVITPSVERALPPCPHFGPGKCGGCHWQHASYGAQLRYKTEIVRDQLQRIGKLENPTVAECIGMAEPFYYRNHVQLRPTKDGIGFVREDRAGVYPIDICLIMNEAIRPLFEALRGAELSGLSKIALRGSTRTGQRMVIAEGQNADQLLPLLPDDCSVLARGERGQITVLRGAESYSEIAVGRMWQIHANSFFQVNTEQAETLLAVARSYLGNLSAKDVLVDGYAGAGFFGLSLTTEVGQTYLIESHPAAAQSAHDHAREMATVTVIHTRAEEALLAWGNRPAPTIALLDPPRAGCDHAVLDALARLRVPQIVYVACDPSTQARDIRYLYERGYTLRAITPVDMFPQTFHIETVAHLVHGAWME